MEENMWPKGATSSDRASALVGKRIMWRVKGTIPYKPGYVSGSTLDILDIRFIASSLSGKYYAIDDIDYRVLQG